MNLVKMLRGGQVTLPVGARKALRLREGDYLNLEIRDGILRLKPVSVLDRAATDEQLAAILGRVRPTRADPTLSEDEVMEIAVEEIHAARAAKHAKSRSR